MKLKRLYIILKVKMRKWRKIEKINKFIEKIEKLRNPVLKFLLQSDMIRFILIYLKESIFYSNKFVEYKVKDIKSYCKDKGYNIRVVEQRKIRQVCKPAYFGICEEKIIEKESPDIYIAELEEVVVTGANTFLIGECYCLYDLAMYDKERRYDLRFESLIKINNKKACVAEKKKATPIEELAEAICLVGIASYNYYHITVEILSRLAYVDEIMEYQKLPILVDSVVESIPQFARLLEFLNTKKHPVIYLGNRKRIKVKKLIYPSYNTWMPVNIHKHGMMKPEDFLIANSAIWNIRRGVLQDKTIDEERANRKIFISRRNNKTKRLVNEDKIAQLFSEYGFDIIYPEEISLEEQIKIYMHTKYFACTTGAALTNIIYAPSSAHVICIIPREYGFCLYSTIAHLLGQRCTFLNAKVVSKNEALSSDDFVLKEEECKRFLRNLYDDK